jgi:hypothetical protein
MMLWLSVAFIEYTEYSKIQRFDFDRFCNLVVTGNVIILYSTECCGFTFRTSTSIYNLEYIGKFASVLPASSIRRD